MISEKISINILIKENRYIDKQYVFFILICRSLARQPKNLSKPHFHRNLQQINTTATLRHCDTATLRHCDTATALSNTKTKLTRG